MDGFNFVSIDWLVWMTLTTILFWATPDRFRMPLLSILTAAFLAMIDIYSGLLLVVFTFITYLATNKNTTTGKQTVFTIIIISSILLTYKIIAVTLFTDSFIGSIVPLGLSYYSLRCIHFILERYKGKIGPQSLQNLSSYLFFMPVIWIGPIHRFEHFQKDQRRHRWDASLFSKGLERILYGYAKVTILGNFLLNTIYLDWALSFAAGSPRLEMYLEMVRIGLSLYILFSGYSDIAIGFGFLLGFKVIENFNWPYFQKNISDFWRCWHISLTNWCREYIYTSVIAKTRSPALGVIATLVAIGLWHEVSFRYIAWGFYHGLGIIVWQQHRRIQERLPTIQSTVVCSIFDILSILLTVHFVWLGFLLVRQPDLDAMLSVLKILF